jgi:hypothetical protein
MNLNSPRLKEIVKIIIIESIFSTLLIVISLRSYIFGNGLFDYGDQFWYPTTHYLPSSFNLLFNGGLTSFLGFTKIIVSAPGILLSLLDQNPLGQEKIYFVYTFFLFLFFSYVLAELLIRLVERLLNMKLSSFRRELLKFFIVLAVYSNIAIMNLNVDGGTYSDGLIMVFIGIAVAFSVYSASNFRVIIVSGVLLSISALLDPDYYLLFALAILFSSLANYSRSVKARIYISFSSILLSIPVILYTLEGLILTSTGIPANALAGRSIYSAASDYGYVMNPVTSLLLVAHYWSTYSISPPSVLFLIGKVISVPFFGNIVLLPVSWITTVWVCALALYPIVAISSLYFVETRKISVPFSSVWLVSFLMTIWWKVPFLNTLFYRLAEIPTIGSAIGTVMAEPGHFMNMEGISEVVLISITVLNLWNMRHDLLHKKWRKEWVYLLLALATTFTTATFFALYGTSHVSLLTTPALTEESVLLATILAFVLVYAFTNPAFIRYIRKMKKIRLNGRKLRAVAALVVIFIVLLPGWQAYDGSFYPERAWTGNSYGDLAYPGPFDPIYIPSYVVDTYNALTSNLSYATILYASIPNNSPVRYQGGEGLAYLIEENYSVGIRPFLDMENVRYVVTYNDPASATAVLNSSGLQSRYLGKSSYLYINNETMGQIYNANLLLNYSSENSSFYFLYGIIGSMGIIPVISNTGKNTVAFDSLNEKIDILSPSFLLNLSSTIQPADKKTIFKTDGRSAFVDNGTVFAQWSEGAAFPGSDERSLGNNSINLTGDGQLLLFLKGNGTVNGENFSSKNGKWISLTMGRKKFSGNLELVVAVYVNSATLSQLMGNYTLYNEPYNAGFRLSEEQHIYKPHYTLSGQVFFEAKFIKGANVLNWQAENLYYIYLSIVSSLIALLLLPPLIDLARRQKKAGR